MSRTTVLIVSLVSLLVFILNNIFGFIEMGLFGLTGSVPYGILIILAWLAVPFVLHADAKSRNIKPGPWAGLGFLLGGLGGIIYFFVKK